jgi:hypothetical protein
VSSATSEPSGYRDDVLDHTCPVCEVGPGGLCVEAGKDSGTSIVLAHPHTDRDPRLSWHWNDFDKVEKFLEELRYRHSSSLWSPWESMLHRLSNTKDRAVVVTFLKAYPGLWRNSSG